MIWIFGMLIVPKYAFIIPNLFKFADLIIFNTNNYNKAIERCTFFFYVVLATFQATFEYYTCHLTLYIKLF